MNRLPLLSCAAILIAGPALAHATPPSDPQIAQIVVTANSVDVTAGELAKEKTRNPEVKKFAEMMITDHTAVNKSASDLVTRLGVKPLPSDLSKSLADGGAKNIIALRKQKPADFDKAYVDHEVAYHVAVLDVIDKTLVPNATNAELKALIVSVRPAIATHLEHARTLASALNK